jgi:HEAT repeat protein
MRSLLLVSVLSLTALGPLHAAQLLPWRKTEKVDPKTRVPQLLQIVQTEKDEFKRSDAVVELRNYDANQFPDMIPALITVLFTDTRPNVRIDAAQTLSKIRPVSQTVGEALEQAMEKDSSVRVRLQARSALLGYQWAGYRSDKKSEATVANPSLTTPPGQPPAIRTTPEKRNGLGGLFLPSLRTTPTTSARPVATEEPPLAPPVAPIAPKATQPAIPLPAGEGPILP